MASVGVIEAPQVQLTNGLVGTIDKPTSLPTATPEYLRHGDAKSFSQGGSPQGRWGTKEKLTRPQRGRVAGAHAGSDFLHPSRGLRERL